MQILLAYSISNVLMKIRFASLVAVLHYWAVCSLYMSIGITCSLLLPPETRDAIVNLILPGRVASSNIASQPQQSWSMRQMDQSSLKYALTSYKCLAPATGVAFCKGITYVCDDGAQSPQRVIKRVSKLRMSGLPVKQAFWLSVSAPLEDDVLWYISR